MSPMVMGDMVGHPVHGRGTVLYGFGDIRMVKFVNRIDKTFEEMDEYERWSTCSWGDDVVGIAWTETDSRFVPVDQLRRITP